MSSVQDVVTALGINSLASVAFVTAYALLKNQPLNTRVYFAKWKRRGEKMGPQAPENCPAIGRYINLKARTYLHVMDWVKHSLAMPEAKFIEHAGLDSAVYLRIILLGIKIFLPMMAFGFLVLVPLNVTDRELIIMQRSTADFTYNALDTITISNVQNRSSRLWAHLLAAYLYTGWTCFLLYKQYKSIVDMRFKFLAEQEERPDQFTVLCRCIPKAPNKSVKEYVDHFFRVNHPDYYLLNAVVYNANTLSKLVKTKVKLQNKVTYLQSVLANKPSATRPTMKKGFLGLFGEEVDKLDFYIDTIDNLTNEIHKEGTKVLQEESSVMPAAFVSFETRWAAAVCSQAKQSKDSTKWLTEWAPEPCDVYWANLPIPYLQLSSRRLVTLAVLFLLIFFFLIPVGFVQTLANLDKIERNAPFLRPLIDVSFVKSVLQGFLPGLSLTVFLLVLPFVLIWMSIFEGHVSYSKIEKNASIKYLAFMLVNIFLGNVITGSAFEQLKLFIQSPTEIPGVLAKAIPMRATFFITYIMVDGWTSCALELVRVLPLILYYVKSATSVRTVSDRERATPLGSLVYTTALSRLGLYFLLGFVYSIISPLILPFILVFLAAAYLVYRNQMINVYEQRYETAGGYWPIMFGFVIIGLLVMHATLIGLMTLKKAAISTPFLLPLPVCTFLFWYYCKTRFGDAFYCYALEEAKAKDNAEREREPNVDHRNILETAYMHPVLRSSLIRNIEAVETEPDDVPDELSPHHVVSLPRSCGETSDDCLSSAGSLTEEKPTSAKDTYRECEPNIDHRSILETAYMGPVLRSSLIRNVEGVDTETDYVSNELLPHHVVSLTRSFGQTSEDCLSSPGSLTEEKLMPVKDNSQREREPHIDHRSILETAYMDPVLRSSLINIEGVDTESDHVVNEPLPHHVFSPPRSFGQTSDNCLSSPGSLTEEKLMPAKDNSQRECEPNIDHRDILETAYMDPVLRSSPINTESVDTESDHVVNEPLPHHVCSPPRSFGQTSDNFLCSSGSLKWPEHKLLPEEDVTGSLEEDTHAVDRESSRDLIVEQQLFQQQEK